MVIRFLIIILFILMALIGGKRGVKSFFTVFINFTIFFIMLKFITFPINPFIITIIGSMIISAITLFYLNGINIKTLSALLSVLIVVCITLLISYHPGINAHIQGFTNEELDSITSLSLKIPVDFSSIVICMIILGLIGAINDVSVSISSAMNELYNHNKNITKNKLFTSGLNIGKDILGTMTNTLFFAYISGFMMLILYISTLKLSFDELINQKVFVQEVFQIICSGIGSVLIIPVTAFITAIFLTSKCQSTARL